MRIVCLGREVFNGTNPSLLKEILVHVNETLISNELVYSHITVDGMDVYDEPLFFLTEGINLYTEVEIKAIDLNTLSIDTLVSIEEYSSRAIPALNKLADDFYQKPVEESWHKLGELLEGITWFEKSSVYLAKSSALEKYRTSLSHNLNFSNEISILDEAVERQDLVLIGDILKYEFSPRFESLKQEIIQILSKEVKKDAFN